MSEAGLEPAPLIYQSDLYKKIFNFFFFSCIKGTYHEGDMAIY